MTTPLAERLKRQIAFSGPISVTEYMATCLFDPDLGYYTTRQPFGRGGDFVTAPEVSQMFGELVAIWAVLAWRDMGRPTPFVLAEIGPGRGTMMVDILRTIRQVDENCASASQICMIEASTRLAAIQRETLNDDAERIEWLAEVDALPELPVVLVGNELFDALPIRQFFKVGDQWLQRMVSLDGEGELTFATGVSSLAGPDLPDGEKTEPEGAIFEMAPAREALTETIAARIVRDGGAALFFDYGHLQPGFGDTLQAVSQHRFVDVLENPGEADLTSHVDFAALAAVARHAGAETACLTQGEFLTRMGIVERARRLGTAADAASRERIERDLDRLVGDENMGELFKVMTIYPGQARPQPF